MGAFKIDTFGGMIPAVDDRLLPDKSASFAQNVWMYSGTLVGRPVPLFLRNCSVAGTTKVFRLPNNYTDLLHISDSDWLEFSDINTDVVRGATVGDTFDRYYWASPTAVPSYNTRTRIKAGFSPYTLGIPVPGVAPTLSVSGGSGVTVSRAYAYTWVSTFGEEGPPSPPTLFTGKIDGTWVVGVTPPAGAELANRSLAKTRIYRTITSSAGVATYFLLGEIDKATTSFNDSASDTVVSGNNQLTSSGWTGPPSDLQGLASLPNGILAGWRGSELWFCEPFRPHAWPAAYTLLTEYPIVGLAVSDTSLVVCTQGNPYVATGINPASVSLKKLSTTLPCLSRGSIVSTQDGVRFATANGLALITQGGVANATAPFLTPDEWRARIELPTLRAALVGNAYVAYGSQRQGVFESTAFDTGRFARLDFTGAFDGFQFDLSDQRVGWSVLKETTPTTNIMADVWTGEAFMIRDNKVYWLKISDASLPRQTYIWRSKVFQVSAQENLGALKLFFRVPPGTPAQNSTRNIAPVQALDVGQYGLLRYYMDGRLVMTREIRNSGELMRMPSGFKGDFAQWEIEGRVEVLSFQAGSAVKDLARA